MLWQILHCSDPAPSESRVGNSLVANRLTRR